SGEKARRRPIPSKTKAIRNSGRLAQGKSRVTGNLTKKNGYKRKESTETMNAAQIGQFSFRMFIKFLSCGIGILPMLVPHGHLPFKKHVSCWASSRAGRSCHVASASCRCWFPIGPLAIQKSCSVLGDFTSGTHVP